MPHSSPILILTACLLSILLILFPSHYPQMFKVGSYEFPCQNYAYVSCFLLLISVCSNQLKRSYYKRDVHAVYPFCSYFVTRRLGYSALCLALIYRMSFLSSERDIMGFSPILLSVSPFLHLDRDTQR